MARFDPSTERHPAPEMLARFMAGELPVAENRVVTRHLLRGCERCREIAARHWYAGGAEDGASGRHRTASEPPEDWMRRAAERYAERARELERQRAEAPAALNELMTHPAERRLLLVRNSRRFQTWPLAELLLEECRSAGFRDSAEAVRLGELALEVCRHLPAEEDGAPLLADLEARAWSTLANARRIDSDPYGADRAFHTAEALLAEGSGDPLEEAHLAALKAVLRSDQRRFDEAGRLLDRAIRIYRRSGERRMVGQSLIRKGTALGEAGEAEAAIAALSEGVELIDAERDRRWLLAAQHNLILFHEELGRVDEALALLASARPLYSRLGDALNLLRLRWLEGRLARAQADLTVAEAAFSEVADAFVERQMPYDAALATLDLATVHLARRETGKLRRLATETLPIFGPLGIHREAIAALAFLKSAVELETVTVETIRRVSAFLETSRQDPGARFEPRG